MTLHFTAYGEMDREDATRLAEKIAAALGRPVRLGLTQVPGFAVSSKDYFDAPRAAPTEATPQ